MDDNDAEDWMTIYRGEAGPYFAKGYQAVIGGTWWATSEVPYITRRIEAVTELVGKAKNEQDREFWRGCLAAYKVLLISKED